MTGGMREGLALENKKGQSDGHQTMRTAILNTVANAVSLCIGMIMIPVVTRVLSPEDIGVANTFLSNRNIMVIVITMASYSYVNRAMVDYREDKESYIYSIVLFCICMVLLSFVITFPFKSFLMKMLSMDNFLYYWLFVSILSTALFYIADYYCLFYNMSIKVFAMVLATGSLTPVLSIMLSYFFQNRKYIGRVIGTDAAYVAISLILILWLLISGRGKVKKKYIRETLRFTIPIIPHLLSQTVLTQCDLILISYFAGKDKSGIYSMGHIVGYLAFTVMAQIIIAWSPWVYRRLAEGDLAAIRKNSKYMLLIGLLISIGLITISPELIRIFFTEDYFPCIYIVPPLVVATFFQFCYLFLYDLEYFNKKVFRIATASVTAAMLNIILNLVCIPKFGYVAASYTTLASYFALFVMNLWFARKLDLNQTYDMKLIIGSCFTILFYMIMVLFLKEELVIRYIIVLVVFILVGKREGKKAILTLKGIKGI